MRRTPLVPTVFLLYCLSIFVSLAPVYSEGTPAPTAAVSDEERARPIEEAFENGKNRYEAGDYEGAAKEWEKLDPYLEQNPSLKKVVEYFRTRMREELSADKAAAVRTPLEDAGQALASRNEEFEAALQKAKEYSKLGSWKEAIVAWERVLFFVDGDAEIAGKIKEMKLRLEEYEKTQAAVAMAGTLKIPQELSVILAKMEKELQKEKLEVEAQRLRLERNGTDTRAQLEADYERGKIAYEEGDFAGAVAVWEKLLPYVEEPLKLDTEMRFRVLKERLKEAEGLRQSTGSLSEEPEFKSPDIRAYLEEALQMLEKDISAAIEQKNRAEESLSERKKITDEIYAQGLEWYKQGELERAVEAWSGLSPYMDDGSEAQLLLSEARESASRAAMAKKEALQAAAQEYKGLQISSNQEMTQILEAANEKLAREIESDKARQLEMEKTLAERREWAVTTFNKGKILYEQGRYGDALDQWERLLPYIVDGSDLKKSLQALRKKYDDTQAAGQGPPASATSKAVIRKSDSDEMTRVITRANEEMKIRTENSAPPVSQQEPEWLPQLRDLIEQAKDARQSQAPTQPVLPETAAQEVLAPMVLTAKPLMRSGAQSRAPLESAPQLPLDVETIEAERLFSETPAGNPALVSGEVTAVNEAENTITVKLHEEGAEEITVHFDASTQVAGKKLKGSFTISAGTEIDLRYDAQSGRALYVYIY